MIVSTQHTLIVRDYPKLYWTHIYIYIYYIILNFKHIKQHKHTHTHHMSVRTNKHDNDKQLPLTCNNFSGDTIMCSFECFHPFFETLQRIRLRNNSLNSIDFDGSSRSWSLTSEIYLQFFLVQLSCSALQISETQPCFRTYIPWLAVLKFGKHTCWIWI